MEQGLPSYWVGLEIPNTDCHVTIAFRDQSTPDDLDALTNALHKRIVPILPLRLSLGTFQKRGTPPDIPAYNVFLKDKHDDKLKDDVLQSFYHDFTWRHPDKPSYPRLEMHASCKTPKTRAQLEHIINNDNGEFIVERAYIRLLGDPQNIVMVSCDDDVASDDNWAKETLVKLGYTQPH